MEKYRKKPIVIEAEQWFKVEYDREAGHGNEPDDMPIYRLGVGYYRTPKLDGRDKCKQCGDIMHNHGWIDNLGEGYIVCPKDWIIKDEEGAIFPCKPDIFPTIYDKVE